MGEVPRDRYERGRGARLDRSGMRGKNRRPGQPPPACPGLPRVGGGWWVGVTVPDAHALERFRPNSSLVSRTRRGWLQRALALLLAASCAPPHDDLPPSALLLTLDTTNPEALSCYGGPPGLTPHLDRLAAEGILFENARAVAPLTLPAHASLLTGLYPVRHAVRRNGDSALSREATTLAERARDAGFQTAAIVAAVVLAPEFGLDQGFELYDAPRTPDDVEEHLAASRRADDVADRALAWLRERDERRPFFLWLHFYDPHFPYDPPREALELAGSDPYLGEVAAMDAAIGRVLAHLEEGGILERALVAAVADHGEGRGRHGEETHGAFVFDSTLRIPMLVRLPARARAGERARAPVSQVDLHALLASELGLAGSGLAALDGRDPPAADAEHSSAAGVYFESYFGTLSFGWSPLAGWADELGKYVHSSTPEYFDLAVDPRETSNAIERRPEAAAGARARIAELCSRPRLPRAEIVRASPSLQQEIEKLGYAGGSSAEARDPEPLDPSPYPSPHRLTQAYAFYMEGRKVMEEGGSRERAAELLRRALAANPGNHKAWFQLGLALQQLGVHEQALDAFEHVLRDPGGERIPAELNLAVCLYNLGHREQAIERLSHALRDTTGPPGALELLIRLLEESGRADEADRARARLAGRSAVL